MFCLCILFQTFVLIKTLLKILGIRATNIIFFELVFLIPCCKGCFLNVVKTFMQILN